jgi:hypothetical protein
MTWFSERQLEFCPKHFVKANTSIDDEKKLWVLEKLTGRFCILPSSIGLQSLFDTDDVIYFEDPKEAVFYDLTWS